MTSIRTAVLSLLAVFGFAAHAESEERAPDPVSRDAAPSAATAARPDDAWLFDRSRILDVRIEMPDESWQAICGEIRPFADAFAREIKPNPFSYRKATITIGDLRIEDVAIRKKGFIGSLDEERPSLKVHFSKYSEQSPIAGVDRLTLNNNKQDESLGSQWIAYDLFARAGLPAPRVALVRVHVNGEDLGVYSNVESIREPFLMRVFGDARGALFEGTLADFVVGRTDRFEAKTDERESARSVLDNLAKRLAADSLEGDESLPGIEELIDVDSFLRFWALESLIGFWDGYANNQNNYFVYQHPKTARLHWIPWGADAVFQEPPPIPFLPRGPPYSVAHQAALANRLFRDETMRQRYRATLEKLLETVWKESDLLAQFDRIAELVGDRVHRRQAGYRDAASKLRDFISKRREQLSAELERWPVEIAKAPRVPMYMRSVGNARGKFETRWGEKTPERPLENGRAELSLTLNDKTVRFESLGVSAEPAQPGFGEDPSGPRPPAVVFTGAREDSKGSLTLGFSPSRTAFAPSGEDLVRVQGILVAGSGFFGVRFVSGTVRFEAAKMEAEAPVVGTCELEVFQMVMPR